MASPTLYQDQAAEIFFRAFKDCASNIINDLPQDADPNNPNVMHAILTIAAQLNHDFARLQYVIEVIQSRIQREAAWATTTAVKIYELLAMSIDPQLSHPSEQLQAVKGAFLVRDEMMRMCQAQFELMIMGPQWSCGLMGFLGQLCSVGSITSSTPRIVLHILASLVASTFLNNNGNFDMLAGFILHAGPFLDNKPGYEQHLTAMLQQLDERARTLSTSERLAVYGILRLREKGWQLDELDEVSRVEQ
jgi:hypothetical protein